MGPNPGETRRIVKDVITRGVPLLAIAVTACSAPLPRQALPPTAVPLSGAGPAETSPEGAIRSGETSQSVNMTIKAVDLTKATPEARQQLVAVNEIGRAANTVLRPYSEAILVYADGAADKRPVQFSAGALLDKANNLTNVWVVASQDSKGAAQASVAIYQAGVTEQGNESIRLSQLSSEATANLLSGKPTTVGKKDVAASLLYYEFQKGSTRQILLSELTAAKTDAEKEQIILRHIAFVEVGNPVDQTLPNQKPMRINDPTQILDLFGPGIAEAADLPSGPIAVSLPTAEAPTPRPTFTQEPSPTPPATETPLPTETPPPTPTEVPPTATPSPTPRPDAEWVDMNGSGSLLSASVWNRDYGGGDKRTVTNGVLIVTGGKNDWFTEPNPKTKTTIKGPFEVVVKMEVEGTGGIILDGRPQSGAEWWQGMRRIFIGQDGEPVLGFRDGTTSAEQRISLTRIPKDGVILRFSQDGATVEVLDSQGRFLTRRSGPQRLSQPAFPDGTVTIGTNVTKGSTLTVSDLDMKAPAGGLVWSGAPAANTGGSTGGVPKTGEQNTSGTRKDIPLKPEGPNPVSQLPDQVRAGGSSDNQRQFVLYRIPGAPIGDGAQEEIVSQYIVGPIIKSVWSQNGQVFISFNFQGKDITGRFLSNPYSTQVITTRDDQGYTYGHTPEEIPMNAKLALYLQPGSVDLINQSSSEIVNILGLIY